MIEITPDTLRRLLMQDEGPTLEFKRLYDLSRRPDRDKTRDEVIKDILALTNSGGRTADDDAQLVIGADNDIDGILGLIRHWGLATFIRDFADPLRDLCESGLLTLAGGSLDAVYVFLHRTVLEYLVASRLATDPAETLPLLTNPDAHTVLWMVAGKLPDASDFLARVVDVAEAQLTLSREASPDAQSPVLAELLTDCIFECGAQPVAPSVRDRIWDLVTRGLDRAQRRRRRREWAELVQPSLVYRALRAIELQDPAGGASEMGRLIADVRRARYERGGRPRREDVPDALQRLADGTVAPCPIVRWVALWTAVSLHTRGWPDVAERLGAMAATMLLDPCIHVRPLAARALVQLQPGEAYEPLRAALDGDRHTAAGAAVALGRLGTPAAVALLKDRTRAVLEERVSVERDPLPIALVGALEDIVSSSDRTGDPEIAEILSRALAYPLPLTRATAASGLGKLRRIETWSALQALVETPTDARIDTATMRASACFACADMCDRLDNTQLTPAVAFFQRRLHDRKEIPGVRRPAAIGLGRIAENGYKADAIRSDLLTAARDADLTVTHVALFHLMRLPQSVVGDALARLMEVSDQSHRLVTCDAAHKVGSVVAVATLQQLLALDPSPTVVTRTLFTVSDLYRSMQAGRRPAAGWVGKVDLLAGFAQRCVNATTISRPATIETAFVSFGIFLSAVNALDRTEADRLRGAMAPRARALLGHSTPRVASRAATALGFVGVLEDRTLLQALIRSTPSAKIRDAATAAIGSLERRWRR